MLHFLVFHLRACKSFVASGDIREDHRLGIINLIYVSPRWSRNPSWLWLLYTLINWFQVFDERCNCWLYTLDKGITRFYDLLQLIEFYQLNAGCLPTRLTHYVQNGVPEMLPLPVPVPLQQEDGGGSPPSPIELDRRLSSNVGGATTPISAAYNAGHKSIWG